MVQTYESRPCTSLYRGLYYRKCLKSLVYQPYQCTRFEKSKRSSKTRIDTE
jgi:hypothetical protein